MTYEQAIRAVEHVKGCMKRWSAKAPALIQDEIEPVRSVLTGLVFALQEGLVQNENEPLNNTDGEDTDGMIA